ncbi:MAG: phenylalanine--tRNA ligase subunit beta [Clostridia bacterium]
MLISLNWISDFVDLQGIDKLDLIKRFTLSTAEVEDIYHKGDDLKDVVVGKILSIENHPKSKKLHLLKVDGGDKIYDVVCGAPNVEENMLIPFVKSGGKVGGHDITTANVAGYESHGMCCSEAELGISADHSGLMKLPEDLVVGTDIKNVYAISDIVFEVDNKSLTNRPDLWGHYGIAREIAALTGRPLKALDVVDLEQYSNLPALNIEVKDELCRRYSGLTVANVTENISPVNLRIRLFYCGSRAINLLADLTNYLMMEMGQPMHAFDLGKVSQIEVKRYETPFEFKTLDGETRKIDENTLMITNGTEPVAIAGIMGGLESEIEDDTNGLLLESASFDAVCVRKSSTRLGLRTDASMRYEKTLDPEMTVTAIERFLKLLTNIDAGVKVTSSLTDKYIKKYDTINLEFTKAYVDRYTGIEISNEQILSTLIALGFSAKCENDVFSVTVPSWRATKDVTIKADIIEEITRIYGYDNFEVKSSKSVLEPVIPSVINTTDYFAKDILAYNYKLHEVHSYIWCDSKKYKDLGIDIPQNVKLINSINPDCTVIRTSVIPNLLSFVNENKSYGSDYGIFEIGRVVDGLDENNICKERKKLAVVLFSRNKTEKDLFFEVRDIAMSVVNNIKHRKAEFAPSTPKFNWQHPMNTAEITLDGINIGFMNTIYPTVQNKIDKKAAIVALEIDMTQLAIMFTSTIAYNEPSKFPGIDIDLTLVVAQDVTFNSLKNSWENVTDLLKDVSFVDVYQGLQKSITLRFKFVSKEKTLSKAEIQEYIDEILKNLSAKNVNLKL